MKEPAFVDLAALVFEENDKLADEIRNELTKKGTLMINVMSSPGAGKTTLIQNVLKRISGKVKAAVVEGDVESKMDADKIAALGVPAVQLRTGGGCHLDAGMIKAGLDELKEYDPDLIIIENIGNLVCPAEFDTGAHYCVTILSIPEGDDKPVKYPLMYSVCDAMIISKIDTKSVFDFDIELAEKRAGRLNPNIKFFHVSAKTGEGMDFLTDKLLSLIEEAKKAAENG